MKKLSQEAEDYINQQDYSVLVDKDKNAIYRFGMKAALINPILLEKQGLISLEGMFEFINWSNKNATQWLGQDNWEYDLDGKDYTTAQLYEIYQEQKEK